MEDQNRTNPVLAFSTVLAFLATIGILVYPSGPFKGGRPAVPDMPCSLQKVQARLWQDPFRAVLEYQKKKGPGITTAKLSQGVLDFQSPRNCCISTALEKRLQGDNITILGVMVPGGPYSEAAEHRHRWRYAALAGLRQKNVAGPQQIFFPKDSEHLEFLEIIPAESIPKDRNITVFTSVAPLIPAATGFQEELTLENIIPFEWLSTPDHNNTILLLWLNEDVFAETPRAKLQILQE
jgi:hypothetical protein